MATETNFALSSKFFAQLSSYIVPKNAVATKNITIPYPLFIKLYSMLLKETSSLLKTKQLIASIKKDQQKINESVSNYNAFSLRIYENILAKLSISLTNSKGNFLCSLLQFSNSLNYFREQLFKTTKLIENSINVFNQHAQNGHNTKMLIVLQPIKQFIESAIQRVKIAEEDMKKAEISEGFSFNLFTKLRDELNIEDRKKVEKILRNPIINEKLSKIAQYTKMKSSRPTTAKQNEIEEIINQPPETDKSCSVTELEDFVYNLLHGEKTQEKDKADFKKDVSLADLMNMSKDNNNNAEIVPSPIATSTGCLKDIEAISKPPVPEEFDPKKVKKIEFSDDKLSNKLKEEKGKIEFSKEIDSIDKIALSTALRNQSQDGILKFKDYVKMLKQDAKGKSPLEIMLGSDDISAASLASSFDVPMETKESFASLKSVAMMSNTKSQRRNLISIKESGRNQKTNIVQSEQRIQKLPSVKKENTKKNIELVEEYGIESKKSDSIRNKPLEINLPVYQVQSKKIIPQEIIENPHNSLHKKNHSSYNVYFEKKGEVQNNSVLLDSRQNRDNSAYCVPIKSNQSYYQESEYQIYNPKSQNNNNKVFSKDGMKRSKSIIAFPQGIILESDNNIKEHHRENSISVIGNNKSQSDKKGIPKTNSVRSLVNRKSEGSKSQIKLPGLGNEERKSVFQVRKVRKIIGKDSLNNKNDSLNTPYK